MFSFFLTLHYTASEDSEKFYISTVLLEWKTVQQYWKVIDLV